jgi:hypothetical protein
MHEILLGIPFAILTMIIVFIFLYVVINHLTENRFLLICGIAMFLFISYVFGIFLNPAHAEITSDSILEKAPTYCQKMKEDVDKVESNIDDAGTDETDGYDTLVKKQEKYQTECEEEGN